VKRFAVKGRQGLFEIADELILPAAPRGYDFSDLSHQIKNWLRARRLDASKSAR
jgi:hypothetical protein